MLINFVRPIETDIQSYLRLDHVNTLVSEGFHRFKGMNLFLGVCLFNENVKGDKRASSTHSSTKETIFFVVNSNDNYKILIYYLFHDY